MRFLSLFFLLGLLAAALAQGRPSTRDTHVDSTVITLSDTITPDGLEHLFISIDRIEDDVSDKDGSVLAERDIRVALRFDVDLNQQVSVNGVPAPFGYSELSVEAQIYEVVNSEHVPFGEVVSIQLRLSIWEGSVMLNSGVPVSTLVIQERVVAIQETEVWQAEVVQQVFVVQQDGGVVRFETTTVGVMNGEPAEPSDQLPPPPNVMPPLGDDGKPPGHHGNNGGHHGEGHHGEGHHGNGEGHHGEGHHQGGHHGQGKPPGHHGDHEGKPGSPQVDPYPGMGMDGMEGEEEEEGDRPKHGCAVAREIREFFHHAARWFHSLPFYLRILVAFAGGIVLGLVGVMFVKIFCGLCCRKRRCCSKKEGCHAAPDYKQNLRVYSLQYTAVPQEEEEKKEKKEEEKKEKEENAIQMV